MPPLIPLPKTDYPVPTYSEAQVRYSVDHGGGLGSTRTQPRRSYVETPHMRHLRESDEYEIAQLGWIADDMAEIAAAAAATEPEAAAPMDSNPSEALEMPDVPEEPNPFGIGTYDAAKGKNKGKAKGKTKGKTKDKSKSKSKGKSKGKDRGSRSDSSHSAWGRMCDFWRYDSA